MIVISLRERDQALARLGVSQWYSNKVLEGAALSPDLSFDVASLSQELAVSDVPPQSSSVVRAQEASASKLLQDLNLPTSGETGDESPRAQSEEKISVVDSNAIPSMDKTPNKAFCLRTYRAEGVLVVSSSALDFAAQNEVALLSNILSACGIAKASPMLLSTFNWPVFNLAALPGNVDSSASELILKWLGDQLDDNTKTVITMGEAAQKIGVPQDEENKTISPTVIKLDVSLLEMISMPAKKAIAWRQLLPHITNIRDHA